jgi:hypothetical protein
VSKPNSLQAVLDRASTERGAAPATTKSRPMVKKADIETELVREGGSSIGGSRRGTKMIGGHFPPEVSTQLRILAAEEDRTVQSLIAEALDDLFVKKGRSRMLDRT